MKKLILLTLLLSMIFGCSQNESSSQDVSQKSDKQITQSTDGNDSDVIYAEYEGNFAYDITDTQYVYDHTTEVVLIHIDSIDGVDNYSSVHDDYVSTYTYGKATVKKKYKGSLTENQQIDFYRTGGKIEFNDFYNGQPQREQKRLDNLEVKPQYVVEKYKDDIDLEVGKTYLAYIVSEKDIHNNGAYAIIYYQTGLREVQGNLHSRTSLQVYNNYTKSWESIENVLP